jgi:adenosylcobinamide-GDP ribazoletransferase
MRGGAGPFGVAVIVICLGAQGLSFGALAAHGHWWAVAAAILASRAAVVLACRRGASAAPGSGFGTLVAGTQPWWAGLLWGAMATALAALAMPARWWLGALSVLVALTFSFAFTRHCVRRFGGLSGDVLGAAIELTLTISAVLLTVQIHS